MGNSLSVNLVDFVPGHLSLLYHVSRNPDLTSPGDRLSSAIKRYKNFMFLRSYDLAQHTSLEVEWVWYISRYKAMNPQHDNLHLVDHFDFHCNITKPLPRGIQNAIDNFYPSFDIVSAAIRQRSFLAKAKIFFGCTKQDFKKFEKDYILFLKLLSERAPREILVPTLAIDLMWHTHLRIPEIYFIDSKHFLGRLLDHDDNMEFAKIDDGLQKTAQLWLEKYKKKYFMPATDLTTIKPTYTIKSFEEGTLFAIGAWGYVGYSLGSCDNSTWEWEGDKIEYEKKQSGMIIGVGNCGASVCGTS